jgi:hypothetical protein
VSLVGLAVPLLRRAFVLEAVALGGILALAAWLRLAGLDRTSLFGDESLYSGQSAGLAGDPVAASSFGLFVSHPLLFQLLLAIGFAGGLPAEGGRILTGLFGVGSVALAWAIGRLIGGRALGLAAAVLLAVLAYQAYVSRLILLDGPEAFAVGCSLYAFLRARRDRSGTWLAISAGALGAAVLTKETAVLILPAVAIAAIVEPRLHVGLRAWLIAGASFCAVAFAIPVSVLLGGGLTAMRAYLEYQLSRHSQSSPLTYLQMVDPYVGWPFVILAVIGIAIAIRRAGAPRIIAIWTLVPAVVIQAWGLRELQQPMLVVLQLTLLVVIALEALAHGLAFLLLRFGLGGGMPRAMGRAVAVGLLAAVALGLVPLTLTATRLPNGRPVQSGLREASVWLRDHSSLDEGVYVSTAYKSSVVAYYSRRPAYGYIPPRRRDPIYRDPGDMEAFWRAGGIRWVVVDRDSQARAAQSEDDTPHDRLVDLLAAYSNELAYVVPGRTPDAWLAQVYRITERISGQPTSQASLPFGQGDGGVVAISYVVGILLGAIVIVIGHRTRPDVSDPGSRPTPESSSR